MNWNEIIAKSRNSIEWRLLGNISKWDELNAIGFNSELQKLEAKKKDILIKLHCGGGSIYEGLQMYQRLLESSATIDIDVEGIAASMGSAVFMSGKKRRIARFGRIMIHQGRGGLSGASAKQMEAYAKELKDNNEKLAEIYARAIQWKHPQRNQQWVLDNWMGEGQNTWFNADQAKAEGLVHEIYDGSLKTSPSASLSFDDMVAHYDLNLTQTAFKQSSNDMKREEILAKHGLSANASNDELLAKMEELDNQINSRKHEDIHANIDACVLSGAINVKQSQSLQQLVADGNGEIVASILGEFEANNPNIELTKPTKKAKSASELNESTASLDDYRKLAPEKLLDDPDLFDRLYAKEYGESETE